MTHSLSEAAKQLGVSTSLIRRYEKEFELNFARTEQGRCMLTDRDLTNLRIIRSFRQQGMAFDEIKAQLRPQEPVELVSAETSVQGPEIREVLSALVRRQDELESVVAAQQAQITTQQERIDALMGENRKLLAGQEQLQLAAPPVPSEELDALRERLSGLEAQAGQALQEASKDEVIRRLQRRLLELEGSIAAQMDHPDPEEGMLDELATAIQALATQQRKRWWEFWK
ncbi:polar chromosome segregation protein [compost metagenome]